MSRPWVSSAGVLPFLVVQQIMRRIAHSGVHSWLLLAAAVGLLGCPLLLDDGFSVGSLSSEPDAGDPCIGSTCHTPYSNSGGSSAEGGAGGESGGSAGVAGTPAVAGAGGAGAGGSGSSGAPGSSGAAGSNGSAGAGNSAGSGGSAGSAGSENTGGSAGAGSAGTSGTADAGGSAGTSGEDLACWTLELTDGSHDSSNNCLGIAGTNSRQQDSETAVTLSYQNGDPCFSGTIGESPDWGATFEFDFATGTGSWDADAAGVTGFEFAYRGSAQPPSVRVLYKDPSGIDNCRVISPGTTSVPFSAAHPNCSTSSSAPVVDSSELDELILAILPGSSQPYAVDFCIQIRALD